MGLESISTPAPSHGAKKGGELTSKRKRVVKPPAPPVADMLKAEATPVTISPKNNWGRGAGVRGIAQAVAWEKLTSERSLHALSKRTTLLHAKCYMIAEH
jgi:hypothetical protein